MAGERAGRNGTARSQRLYGLLLVGGATVLWSTAGFFVRLIDLDAVTMVGWRSLFALITLLVIALGRGRGRLSWRRHSLGWPGLAYVPLAALAMVSYVVALRLTAVANVMTVYATVPFIAALLAYLLLREKVGPVVLIASAIAGIGVMIMAGAATAADDLAGNLIALVMTIGFAATVVMARRWPSLDLTLATALASGLCALVCLWLAPAGPMPSLRQMGWLFLFSLATQSLSYLLFLLGGRFLPAAEAGLVALLDVVLAPLWVWLAFAEQPTPAALVGGGLTVIAVLFYLLWPVWRRSAVPAAG